MYPYKIIHKFKNANNKYQYLLYVFIGKLFDDNIQIILENIKNYTFLQLLLRLPLASWREMAAYYGEEWFYYLFPWEHIRAVLRAMSEQQREEVRKKFGEDWYAEHMVKKRAVDVLAFDEFIRRKHRLMKGTTGRMAGGGEEEVLLDDLELDMESQQEMASSGATELLTMEERKESFYVPFKRAKNEAVRDDDLSLLYEKQYIYNIHIYHDDTVEEVKEKISISIQNNSIIYEEPVTIPPYGQYLFVQRKKQRYPLTHTYIQESEPVLVLAEPLAVSSYLHQEKQDSPYNVLHNLLNKSGRLLQYKNNDGTILHEFADYTTYHEIFLVDLYSELHALKREREVSAHDRGLIYSSYVRYYFPLVGTEHYSSIFDMLEGASARSSGDKVEYGRIMGLYGRALEKYFVVNEVMQSVERLRYEGFREKSSVQFGEQKIVHCIVYTYISGIDKITNKPTIDMYRIFDNFEVNEDYPLVTYHAPNIDLAQKIYNKIRDIDVGMIKKWLQGAAFGLLFKVRLRPGKYMTVNINLNYRLEFKAQWKESENATLEDIAQLYAAISGLINKINAENSKLEVVVPRERDYVFSFINVLQEFSIENIDHNKLSELCRYFFPYVTLVIDPKKRKSKGQQNVNVSKFGTYLRYKRITDYDSISRIEKRILYILKNYEVREDNLVQIIAGEFNLIESVAMRVVKETLAKFSNVKKNRNKLKSVAELTKLKQSGIGIDVQGRSKTQLKIKYTGLRHIFQADDISAIMRVIMHVYDQIYNRQNKKFNTYLEMLQQLTNVAKRKRLVLDRVAEEEGHSRQKLQMLDEDRFSNLEGLEWARACQNSGVIRRQPKQHKGSEELLQLGYSFNEATKLFEKEVEVDGKKLVIYAAALESPTGDELYYTCTPEENNDFYHVGFLTKGVGDKCVPCCFKKNQGDSNNQYKKQHYNKCMNKVLTDIYKAQYNVTNLKPNDLYLLQPEHRLHNYKFQLLPYHLNILFNIMTKKKFEMKKQYLQEAVGGVYLKYGILRKNSLLQCFSLLYDTNEYAIRERMQEFKEWHVVKNGQLLHYYKTIENLKEALRYINNPSLEDLHDILCYPGIISAAGINIYLFKKSGDYFLRCINYEDIHQYKDTSRDIVVILEEEGIYYPVLLVLKHRYRIEVERVYREERAAEIRRLLQPYLDNNCNIVTTEQLISHFYPKIIYPMIKDSVTGQFLNSRFKCVFVVLGEEFLLPVSEGGAMHGVRLVEDINVFKHGLKESLELIRKYGEKYPQLRLKARAVVYNEVKGEGSERRYRVYGFQIDEVRVVPMKVELLTKKEIYAIVPKEIIMKNELIMSKIDRQIARRSRIYDERVAAMNTYLYESELYELLRLHLSHYFVTNTELRKKVLEILGEDKPLDTRRRTIKLFLLRILSPKLYNKLAQRSVSGQNELVVLGEKKVDNYELANVRELCELKGPGTICDSSSHCFTHNNRCKLMISSKLLLDYIQKITEEIVIAGIKREELFNNDKYYVTDIVNTSYFTSRDGQSIIKRESGKGSSIHGEKILKTIFQTEEEIFDEEGIDYTESYKIFGNIIEQPIIPNNNTIFRAFANGYYWLNSVGSSIEEKNLGYYSRTQTNIANYVKSKIIDWIAENDYSLPGYRADELELILNKVIMFDSYVPTNAYDVELVLLSAIFKVGIVVLDNKNNEIKRYGRKNKNSITIKLEFKHETDAIGNVYAIYYKE